ncbi:MAG: 50S ribosomal protein L20 [candidate division WOR-3 bacterium]|nr:50S ribosomal protein L20 [candidate division WOR-3 bacterium]
MARHKNVVQRRKRHKKILKRAEGFFGKRKSSYRIAKEAVMKALAYAYRDRRRKKRDFRRLWIIRINAAARQNGLSYSKFMHGLYNSHINLNRKVLAEIAVMEPETFSQIAGIAKESLNES